MSGTAQKDMELYQSWVVLSILGRSIKKVTVNKLIDKDENLVTDSIAISFKDVFTNVASNLYIAISTYNNNIISIIFILWSTLIHQFRTYLRRNIYS